MILAVGLVGLVGCSIAFLAASGSRNPIEQGQASYWIRRGLSTDDYVDDSYFTSSPITVVQLGRRLVDTDDKLDDCNSTSVNCVNSTTFGDDDGNSTANDDGPTASPASAPATAQAHKTLGIYERTSTACKPGSTFISVLSLGIASCVLLQYGPYG